MEAIAIPIITGVTEAIKRAGVASRFAPLVALVLGVATTLYLGGVSGASVLQGVIYGLSSVGLFSGVRATIK